MAPSQTSACETDLAADYLLVDDAPRRRFRTPERSSATTSLASPSSATDDLHLVVSFIDALVTKTRLNSLAGGIS